MTPASLLAALIAIAPPLAFEPPASAEPPPPQLEADDGGYADALAKVREAMNKANEEPAVGVAPLRDALNILSQHAPQLATDLAGQELRVTAQLTLARALLKVEDPDGAREAMDEAIRTSRGDPLPTKSFGPGVDALYRERFGVLDGDGKGGIDVTCNLPCRVFINERPADAKLDGLFPGKYRLWIEASDGSVPRIEQSLEIVGDGLARLEFGPRSDVGPTPAGDGPKPRLLPRWADVLIMSAGVAAIGTGAALWALDGRCPGGADPNDTDACPQVYITKTAGIISVAAGGAVFLTGTVLLTVDEVRTANNKRAQTVSLGWTFRF